MPTAAVFVGRERELADLVAGLDDAVAGRGRLFLLGGEPGIGKSTLAEELAGYARERGVRVLSGRCWEAGGAPPYWPWMQSMRSLVEELDPDTLRSYAGRGAADIAQLLPELSASFGDPTEVASSDPDTARFRMFDATTTFLRNASRDHPVVVTLEDLHASDTPSLLLLEFLARDLPGMRVLIVATYRDVEVTRDHPLAATLPELAREAATRRIVLGGLGESDVERFISQTAGVSPSARLVDVVSRETEGNPLFIGEIVRLLVSEGRLAGDAETTIKPIPQGIRDVIARRVGHISERCNHVLEIASVLGREFTLDVLGRLSERPADELIEILDEAVAARLVSETPGVLAGMRFSHSLIRDVLYEEMSSARRVRLHRRAAQTLEELRAGDREYIAELAHHFFAAAPTGDVAKAIHYARAVAEDALARLAFEEAVRLYRMALQAMALEEADEGVEMNVLLALGDALSRAGDADSARLEFFKAAEIARHRGDVEALGRAAIGYGGRFSWSALREDAGFVPLLEEALAAVGDSNTSLRVMLMGRLAAGPYRDAPDPGPRRALASQALELARKLGDPETLAYALEAWLGAHMGPQYLDELLAVSDEIESRALASNNGEQALMVHVWRLMTHLYRGNMPAVSAERYEVARVADQLRQDAQIWFLIATDAALAILAGRFDEAERLAATAYEAGRRADTYAVFAYHLQMLWIRMEQGREAEMRDGFLHAEKRFTMYPLWHSLAPYLLLTCGTLEGSRAAFRKAIVDVRPMNEEWLLGEGVLADAAASLGEAEAAAALYDELVPYAALTMGGIPDINIGSTSRVLGRLAAVIGRDDDAERHFRYAVESNDGMGARPWAAWARYDHAAFLLSRGMSADRPRAQALLAEASVAARDRGMTRLERAVASAGGPRLEPRVPVSADQAEGTFRREGEYWTVAIDGESFRLKDAKGLRYLATLLAAPGREFHALDLVASGGGSEAAPATGEVPGSLAGVGDAGEVLDPEAKAAYKRRLTELEEEIDEARSWGDDERAARADEEREALVGQLAGAVGLGGRDRRAASNAERARVNVTRAIKAVLARIAENSRGLAKHLEATIHTGTFCSYTPDPRTTTTWRT